MITPMMPKAYVYYLEFDGKVREFVNADAYREMSTILAKYIKLLKAKQS